MKRTLLLLALALFTSVSTQASQITEEEYSSVIVGNWKTGKIMNHPDIYVFTKDGDYSCVGGPHGKWKLNGPNLTITFPNGNSIKSLISFTSTNNMDWAPAEPNVNHEPVDHCTRVLK